MDFKDVEKLILLMKQHDLSQLEVKEGESHFSAKRGGEASAQPQYILSAPQNYPSGADRMYCG